MSDLQLEGVYVPVVTPFDADEGLDLSTLTKVIDFCLDGGVRGVVSCGTTGEYYAMSSDERKSVMAHTAEVVGNAPTGRRLQCRIDSRGNSLAEAAITMGYDAIMLAAHRRRCRRSASWRRTTGLSPMPSTSRRPLQLPGACRRGDRVRVPRRSCRSSQHRCHQGVQR
jgi:hypothetical protein